MTSGTSWTFEFLADFDGTLVEMNEKTMPWHGTDTNTYINCYRHTAQNIRATNPAVLLGWSINGHGTPAGEWGVVPTGRRGQGNPDFIRWTHAWFAAHAPDLAYEAYFSDCGSGGMQSSPVPGRPWVLAEPRSAQVYRMLFGS